MGSGGITIPKGKRLYRLLGLLALMTVVFVMTLHGTTDSFQGLTSTAGGGSKKKIPVAKPVEEKNEDGYTYVKLTKPVYKGQKERATFVTLARNKDLYNLLPTIKSFEDRFNSKFQYDWVFLNDEEFSDEFKKTISPLISGETKFGVIPKDHWSFPSWIDQDRAAQTRKDMAAKKIIYGDSVSYRHMCRYESGFFWRHPLLDDYDWYWRVEPDTKLHCDVDYDVFRFMKDNGKKYGFSISIKEYAATIETLWKTTKEFMSLHPEHLAKNNMLDFISDDNGNSYNLCHFWSNFEIASLNLWRDKAYTEYFDYLDNAGGFFYERWGDAPVHSIAAALFLNRDEIHHFGDFGYYHGPYHSCPIDDTIRFNNKCDCKPKDDFTWKDYSCTRKYYDVNKLTKPDGWKDHTG